LSDKIDNKTEELTISAINVENASKELDITTSKTLNFNENVLKVSITKLDSEIS